VVPLLRQRLRGLAERAAETRRLVETALAQDVPELFLIEEQYRLAINGAESSYVTSLIDQITDPHTGWGPMWAEFHGETLPARAPHDQNGQPNQGGQPNQERRHR
jgi:hypothetical protein